MAHVFRLILLLVFFYASSAFADTPVNSAAFSDGGNSHASCVQSAANLQAAFPSHVYACVFQTGNATWVAYQVSQDGVSSGNSYYEYYTSTPPCGSGASFVSSSFSCHVNASPAGTVLTSGWFKGSATAPSPVTGCYNGTEGTFQGSGPYVPTGSTQNYWKGSYISTGNSCSSGEASVGSPAANPTAPATTVPSTAPSAPAPTATTPSPTAVTPYSGPTVTNNTVTNNINTTTTTTTTDSNGVTTSGSSTTTGTQSGSMSVDFGPVVAAVNQTTGAVNQTTDAVNKTTQAIHDNSFFQFCIDNPTLPECQPSSVIDACNAFSCSGDAIQCAMLQTQHDIVCQYSAEKNPQLDIGQQMISGTDTSVPNPADSANRIPVSLPSALDSSSPIVASCPQDVVFSFQGHQVTMPVSTWCPMLAVVGNIFLALSFLAAAKIIGSEI